MIPNFTAFDASTRVPRPIQSDTLAKLTRDWDKADIHALILPVGAGKSAVARAIQVATGADILTPSNALVSQYVFDYPYVNALKGKAHYTCSFSKISCKDWQECGMTCEKCPYDLAKARAVEGHATFFNPMSYYYFMLSTQQKGNKVLVVDEAHNLSSMVLMLCGNRLKRSDYKFTEKCTNELILVRWLADQIQRLERLSALYYKRHEMEKLQLAKDQITSLSLLKAGLDEDPQNYVIWIDTEKNEQYLNIKPIFPPRFLMDRIIGGKKVILMSGTLFDYDIKAIAGDQFVNKIEQNSPIPRKNRQVIWKPAPFPINYQTDPRKLAEYILKFVDPKLNTLVHITYSLSKKLAPFFPSGTHINSNEDKEEVIEQFKLKGGLFLASGCSEGLDFRGDVCKLNIIPKLQFPDLKDPGVQKRKALQDGDEWYSLQTMLTLIQAAGRSTRAPDDFSTCLVLDPNFGRIFERFKSKLPKYFVESVQLR